MQFALVDNAILMGVQEFDQIFNGQNVDGKRLVDEINNCRES